MEKMLLVSPSTPGVSGITQGEICLVLLALLFAVVGALLLTPPAMALAKKYGVIDAPGGRRVHAHPTPRWGGLAMCAAFVLAVLALIPFSARWLGEPFLDSRVLGILVGGILITILGAVDDKYSVPAKIKLLGQVLVATLMVLPIFGVRLLPLDPHQLVIFNMDMSVAAGSIFTVLWIVAITNTINLIDGLDGLAAGISGIAAFTFAVIGVVMRGAIGEAMLAAAIVGVCLGFLRYNAHPARVFMGDAGSHFLGFTIAALSVLQNWKVATGVAFAVPILILSVPIFDTAFAIVRRLHRGQPIFSPDKGHLHHRLLSTGMHQRSVVWTIYLLTIVGCTLALLIARDRMPLRERGASPTSGQPYTMRP